MQRNPLVNYASYLDHVTAVKSVLDLGTDRMLLNDGWSSGLDSFGLRVFWYPGLCCLECDDACRFFASSIRSTTSPGNGKSVTLRRCQACVKRQAGGGVLAAPCSSEGSWQWSSSTQTWNACDGQIENMQPTFGTAPLPLLKADVDDPDMLKGAARLCPDVSPLIWRMLGPQSCPVNAAGRGFALVDVTQAAAWFTRPGVRCLAGGSLIDSGNMSSNRSRVSFARLHHNSLVVAHCEACAMGPPAGQRLCTLRGAFVCPDGRLCNPNGTIVADPPAASLILAVLSGSGRRTAQQIRPDSAVSPPQDSSESSQLSAAGAAGAADAADAADPASAIVDARTEEGAVLITNPVADDGGSLRSDLDATAKLPSHRGQPLQYKYVRSGDGWKAIKTRLNQTAQSLSAFYNACVQAQVPTTRMSSTASAVRMLRLSPQDLVRKCREGTLYGAAAYLPAGMAALEADVWNALESHRPIAVLDMPGSNFWRRTSPAATPLSNVDQRLDLACPDSLTYTTTLLGPGAILGWRRQLMEFGSVITHTFGSPIVWYIVPFEAASKLGDVLAEYCAPDQRDNCPLRIHHGDLILSPADMPSAMPTVTRFVTHPSQQLVVRPGSVVQAVSLGFAGYEKQLYASSFWLDHVSEQATTCDHDPLLNEALYLANEAARRLGASMPRNTEIWYRPVDGALL